MDSRSFFGRLFGFPSSPGCRREFGENDEYTGGDLNSGKHFHDPFIKDGVDLFTRPLGMEVQFAHQMGQMLMRFFGNEHPFGDTIFTSPSGTGVLPQKKYVGPETGSRGFMLKDDNENGCTRKNEVSEREDKEIGAVSLDELKQLYSPKKNSSTPHQDFHHPGVFERPFRGLFSFDSFFNQPFLFGGEHDGAEMEGETKDGFASHVYSFSFSSSSSSIQQPDVTVEERQTVRDSQGNVTTTVTRRLDNQTSSQICVRKPDGTEECRETLTSSDNNETQGLDKQSFPKDSQAWFGSGIFKGKPPRDEMLKREKDNDSLYERFFGPRS